MTMAILLGAAVLIAACVAPSPPEGAADGTTTGLNACVVTAVTHCAWRFRAMHPLWGLRCHRMRLPVTGRNMTCGWRKAALPTSLNRFGAEGWIVGPPKFALIDGGCADIARLMPVPAPAG